MPLELSRRKLLGGLAGLLVAPAIVRATSLMPVRLQAPELRWASADFAAGGGLLTVEQITREAARLWKETSLYLLNLDEQGQGYQIGNKVGVVQKTVDIEYSGSDRHLSLPEYSRRILKPVISNLKASIPPGAELLEMQFRRNFIATGQDQAHMPNSDGFREAACMGQIDGKQSLRVIDAYDIRRDSLITHFDVICKTRGM